MSYPYWKAFTRRLKTADWIAIAITFAAVLALIGVLLCVGTQVANAPEMLP